MPSWRPILHAVKARHPLSLAVGTLQAVVVHRFDAGLGRGCSLVLMYGEEKGSHPGFQGLRRRGQQSGKPNSLFLRPRDL